MNAENREAPADAAAPDMLCRQGKDDAETIVCGSASQFTKKVTRD